MKVFLLNACNFDFSPFVVFESKDCSEVADMKTKTPAHRAGLLFPSCIF
jgi:hypothetical protein